MKDESSVIGLLINLNGIISDYMLLTGMPADLSPLYDIATEFTVTPLRIIAYYVY